MHRIGWFLFGSIVGAVVMFTSLRYHVVRADDGLHMIPKAKASVAGAYVDIRDFELGDWEQHRGLAVAIMQADKQELLKGAALSSFRQTMQNALNMLR